MKQKLNRDISLIEQCLNERWRPRAETGKTDDSNCALCQYYKKVIESRCADPSGLPCPIGQDGHVGCHGTPVFDWYCEPLSDHNARKEPAAREVAYLEDLQSRLRAKLQEEEAK